ncbi:hypothetical protein WJX74_010026 [Apatococcus lobatus]|uniref:ABC transporter domain-containing protein n=2 Tax=Apatococcus TaxID=904362 RepID=A0AAW1SNT7_9CHLO
MVSSKEKDIKSKKATAVASDEKPKKIKSDSKVKSASTKPTTDTKDKLNKPSKEKSVGKESTTSSSKGKDKGTSAVPVKPPPSRKTQKKSPAPELSDDYLGDIDLPPSDEDEYESTAARAEPEEETKKPEVSIKDQKKLAEKQRKLNEKAVRLKQDALRDDDNVFDVAFENQGETTDTVSATDVKVQNLTIRAKGKVLLENTQCSITAGRRYGLVGPNGKGKSTLLRLLARRQIPVPEGLDVLLVEQEVQAGPASALAAVVAADVQLMALRAEEAELNRRLGVSEDASSAAPAQNGHFAANGVSAAASEQDAEAEADAEIEAAVMSGIEQLTIKQNGSSAASGATPNGSSEPLDADTASDRLAEVYEQLQELGSSSAEARASKILHGLGFSRAMQGRSTSSFSGGWRMRISLARALYIQPTLLLLDEPTNHLDLRAVLWLEEYLTRWKKTLVVVSHDRDFLNTITTDIIHLHDLKLHGYRGNFVQFEEMYEQRRTEQNKVAEKFEKQMKAAKKSGNRANQEKVTKSAKQQQQRKAQASPAFDDQAAASDAPRKWHDYNVHFEFPSAATAASSGNLITLNDVGFKYPSRDDFGLSGLDIGIDMGSRIAIVGPNGAGKSTLMNLLAGDLQPTVGESRRSHTLRVGRYAQHFVDALSMDDSPVEYLLKRYPESNLRAEQMRQQLGRFGLSGHHHLQPICKLSGGQKSRVVFTSIALAAPHILLMDEPTNHLDMQSIDALAEALEEFEGGVVIISHDSQLLSRVCDDEERSEVWVVEDGSVQHFGGYFEDYKEELMKEIAAELEE